MNCRQGDIAITKGDAGPGFSHRMVEVCDAVFVGPLSVVNGPHWYVRPLGWMPRACDVQLSPEGCFIFPDSYMKPFRHPGEDAVDEIVESIGAAPRTLTEVMREVSHG